MDGDRRSTLIQHQGVYYRFTKDERLLAAGTGRAGIWSVWLNGTHLGTITTGTASGNFRAT